MSHSPDCRSLLCDAPGCVAHVAAPVVLSPVAAGVEGALVTPVRWLFVQREGVWRHFCPKHWAHPLPSRPVPVGDSAE